MAICTQQFQIPSVRIPVLKPPGPRVLSTLWSNLCGWINVVYVNCSMIRKPALNTLSSKAFYYRKLSFPVSIIPLIYVMTVLVPIELLARFRAKPRLAIRTTILTLTTFPPSKGKVTSPCAIFASTSFDSVSVCFEHTSAMATFNFYACFFHTNIVSQYKGHNNTRLFQHSVPPHRGSVPATPAVRGRATGAGTRRSSKRLTHGDNKVILLPWHPTIIVNIFSI